VDHHETDRWPTFELVTLRIAPDLPSAGQVLATPGVPKRIIGREFSALSEARLVTIESGRELIAFGSSGLRGVVCLDPANGTIVHVPTLDRSQINPVNSDIDRFTACVAAVIERFPFYSDDDEFGLWEAVGDELAEMLARIDETTATHNCFWVTFVDDVRMGDYSTPMIVDK